MSSDFSQNYFELFGLPVVFQLDQNDLVERYRKLQRAAHPDRFANSSERERRLSIQKAAFVNQAFQQLKSPLQRARYMLELRGVQFDDARETNVEPAFLMEQMEYREALEAVRESKDALSDLTQLEHTIQDRWQQLVNELDELLSSDDTNSLEIGKQSVRKLQFLEKLQQEILAMEEDLLD